MDSHAEKLLREYEEQLEHIQKISGWQTQGRRPEEKRREPGKTELLERIRSALSDLENFQSKDCAHKVEEILEYRLEESTETALEKIREQLKLYEDDAAEQMLRELIEQM